MNETILQAQNFSERHIGNTDAESDLLLNQTGHTDIETFIKKVVPENIYCEPFLDLPKPTSEFEFLKELKKIASENKKFKNYIGQGYYGTITPSVILRTVFENPSWYTQYTPYQAEISQGRLESLLNFQTVVSDLTGLPLANASLLDEATAAAEAMTMFFHQANKDSTEKTKFFVDEGVFFQTRAVLHTRARGFGIEIVTGKNETISVDDSFFGAIIQYPSRIGSINDYSSFIETMHSFGGYVVVATDLLALTILKSPGTLGADAAVGNAQRFGVPLGYGGPHAAFFAAKEIFKRLMPGRIIGISEDRLGNIAYRMALQTREQHIKREKATSNVCTAQALLANISAFYAIYHGPEGLRKIAARINLLTISLADSLESLGFKIIHSNYFDTLYVEVIVEDVKAIAEREGFNFWYEGTNAILISIDETTTITDILDIAYILAESIGLAHAGLSIDREQPLASVPNFAIRLDNFLTHPVFNSHHTETKLMRYIKSLEKKDFSLTDSMIPLGSCTMKLNAATQLIPLSWSEFSFIHPFAPASQTKGYLKIISDLKKYLCNITGFDACSLQPNSGAQGEYAGLITIKRYHEANHDKHRNVVLIPVSAHGTNPASAVMAGCRVVVVKSMEDGCIDLGDLSEKAELHKDELAAAMITYPSTHGVFEASIQEVSRIIHLHGGLVYMDGANMNAQVGITNPRKIGADVCHLNLHKTFAIPHGGGGPGMGPICVTKELAPFLPDFFLNDKPNDLILPENAHSVAATAHGSASILLISYAYIRLLGPEGLRNATISAILNANYMRKRLAGFYPILYSDASGLCAHEFIIDLRPFKISAGIEADDVAKRLMDYGFHAPTVSFPVAGTMMIEPTESESKEEMDRFCDAMISIYHEMQDITNGLADKTDNPLKNAPHTVKEICVGDWKHVYDRTTASFPAKYLHSNKLWPSVARINNTLGDRTLICTCQPTEDYL